MSEKDPLPRWVEPIAWDATGALYSLWTEPQGVRVARSRDSGKTWQQWLIVETKDTTAFFPYVIARGKGELAATWFTASMPGNNSLRAHVARIQVDNGNTPPNVRNSPPFEIDAIAGKEPTTAGEYVPVIFLRGGRLAIVTPILNRPAKRFGFSFWTVPD